MNKYYVRNNFKLYHYFKIVYFQALCQKKKIVYFPPLDETKQHEWTRGS